VLRNKVSENVVRKFDAHCKISGLGNMQLLRRSGKIVHDIGHSTWWRWRQVDKCLCDSVRQTAQVLECVADIEVSQIGNIHFSTRVMNVPTASSTLLRGSRALCRTTALGIVDTLDKVFAHGIVDQSFTVKLTNPLLPASNTPTHHIPIASCLCPELNRAISLVRPKEVPVDP
jgi:hypothetical protein